MQTAARSPYGWFRWVRSHRFARLVLLWLSAADRIALDGPYKALIDTLPGWAIGAQHAAHPMLWDVWKDPDPWFYDLWLGRYRQGGAHVEYRGTDVYALPAPERLDIDAVTGRFDDVLRAAVDVAPDEAAMFEHARAALRSNAPESMIYVRRLPVLAPSTHPLGARRLMAAVEGVVSEEPVDMRDYVPPPRPPAYAETLNDAILAAVNSLS